MTEPTQVAPSEADALELSLAAAKTRRAELRAELEQVEHTIAELERKRRMQGQADAISTPPAPRAASAWDRAVQAMRRKPATDAEVPRTTQVRAAASPVATPPPPPIAPRTPPPPVSPAQAVAQVASHEAAPVASQVMPSPPARPPRPATATTGPSFLHAVETDERLAPNQRDALRGVYLRFVPQAPPRPDNAPRVPADEALDLDPALARGQREAVRTMLDRFLRKPSR